MKHLQTREHGRFSCIDPALKQRCLSLLSEGLKPIVIADLTGVSRVTIAGWAFKQRNPGYAKKRAQRQAELRPVYLSKEWYEESQGVWWR